jgi:L-rhamnose mutarotase
MLSPCALTRTHMADITQTHPDNEPVALPLLPVFHMP